MGIEEDAEKHSLMGLGKVTNTGVREVLTCDLVYVALTNREFEWGSPSLILKKGEEVVGEEIEGEEAIAKMRKKENVWFMLDDFIIYKDRISFPQDIIKKVCHFETRASRQNGVSWREAIFYIIPLFTLIPPPLVIYS